MMEEQFFTTSQLILNQNPIIWTTKQQQIENTASHLCQFSLPHMTLYSMEYLFDQLSFLFDQLSWLHFLPACCLSLTILLWIQSEKSLDTEDTIHTVQQQVKKQCIINTCFHHKSKKSTTLATRTEINSSQPDPVHCLFTILFSSRLLKKNKNAFCLNFSEVFKET